MRGVRLARISAEPLDIAAHLAAVADPRAGGIATFIGSVRDHDPEAAGAVVALEYSAHPDAEDTLHDIAERAIGGAHALVAVSHRIGTLAVGEHAVVVVVATAHRAEAFEICRTVIETIKIDLPIWKRQAEVGGVASWKGLGAG